MIIPPHELKYMKVKINRKREEPASAAVMQKGVIAKASKSHFSQGRVTLSFSTPWDMTCGLSLHQK